MITTKQYFYIGSLEHFAKRIEALMDRINASHTQVTDNPESDDTYIEVDGLVWIDLAQVMDILQVDRSFFTSDVILDLLNQTQREIGEFPIKEFTVNSK